jgi:epoxyqueuosine reductase
MPYSPSNSSDLAALRSELDRWAAELGFQQLGVAGIELEDAEAHLNRWLELGRHGEMEYMKRHGTRRSRPAELLPGTLRVLSARMDYQTPHSSDAEATLANPEVGYVSRYALGRDYHKVIRNRLELLKRKIEAAVAESHHRVFVDSAPVLEKALANAAGLGWIGKHTNVINRDAGSWFFLGEIYTDIPLPIDVPASNHCGTCTACIEVCPTRAIVAPYELDARRCISYLTIELRGAIPVEFRRAMGNRIYGCDDCQLFCPWNKFAQHSKEGDFTPRHHLDAAKLIDLFAWSEAEFSSKTEGSAIRRIGYECWLRNIAVALGNAPTSPEVIAALTARRDHSSELVREHVVWALNEHGASG